MSVWQLVMWLLVAAVLLSLGFVIGNLLGRDR